jgi:hypothetical protein
MELVFFVFFLKGLFLVVDNLAIFFSLWTKPNLPLLTGGGRVGISLIIKARESFSPLLTPKPSSSLTSMSTIHTPSVMRRTCSSPLVATFFIATPKNI